MFEQFKIKRIIKKNRKRYNDYYEDYKKRNEYLYIKRKADFKYLYLVPKFKGIALGIRHNQMFDKKLIKSIIEYFYNTEIILYEEEKLFTNDDIREFYNINRKVIVNTQYFEKEFNAKNEIYFCDINTYILIIEKIDFLTNICVKNFTTEEERFMFILTQILKYIKYVDYHDYRTCMANAVLLGTGVCIDFTITLFKCLLDIGIDCEILHGISKGTKEDVGSKVNAVKKRDHAWNQVKINDKWYNVDITWFLNKHEFKWLLSDDKTFTEDYRHIATKTYHYCRENYDKNYLEELYNKFMKLDCFWKKFDNGEKNSININLK